MNEEKFWQILENNFIYFKEGSWGPYFNEYLLRLGLEISLLPPKERTIFFKILDSKFHSLFTKKHIEIFLLNFLTEDLFSSDLSQKLLNTSFNLFNCETKESLYYNYSFISRFQVFRFNLIIHGENEFIKFYENPLNILTQKRFIEDEGDLSIFLLRDIVETHIFVGIKSYNHGTFEKLFGVIHPNQGKSRIKYGEVIEDMDDLIDDLDDFCGIMGKFNLENKVLSPINKDFFEKKKSLN